MSKAAAKQMCKTSLGLSGSAARLSNIVTLKSKIDKALQIGDSGLIQHRAKALVGLLEVSTNKVTESDLPLEIIEAEALVNHLRTLGYVLPDKRQRKRQKLEGRKEEKVSAITSNIIKSMVRRTIKNKPSPKQTPKLIYSAFESNRRTH